MTNDIKYLRSLIKEGQCCAAVITAMGLKQKGSDNPLLLDAVKALCGGLHSGLTCGALSGAACMMSLLDRESSKDGIKELTEWFKDKYGTADCGTILMSGRPKSEICPGIIESAYIQAKNILIESGYGFNEDAYL